MPETFGSGSKEPVIVMNRTEHKPPFSFLYTTLRLFHGYSEAGEGLRDVRAEKCPYNCRRLPFRLFLLRLKRPRLGHRTRFSVPPLAALACRAPPASANGHCRGADRP